MNKFSTAKLRGMGATLLRFPEKQLMTLTQEQYEGLTDDQREGLPADVILAILMGSTDTPEPSKEKFDTPTGTLVPPPPEEEPSDGEEEGEASGDEKAASPLVPAEEIEAAQGKDDKASDEGDADDDAGADDADNAEDADDDGESEDGGAEAEAEEADDDAEEEESMDAQPKPVKTFKTLQIIIEMKPVPICHNKGCKNEAVAKHGYLHCNRHWVANNNYFNNFPIDRIGDDETECPMIDTYIKAFETGAEKPVVDLEPTMEVHDNVDFLKTTAHDTYGQLFDKATKAKKTKAKKGKKGKAVKAKEAKKEPVRRSTRKGKGKGKGKKRVAGDADGEEPAAKRPKRAGKKGKK